jgi:pentatricopeptide repeat protein
MSIGKYCNHGVVVAVPNISILSAVQLMSHHYVGGLVLAEQVDSKRYRLEGIVTDRDIVLEIVADNEREPERIRVGDTQLRGLLRAKESEDAFDVIGKMRRFDIRRLPGGDDRGWLAGMVSADDLLVVQANYQRDLSLLLGYQNLREENERKEVC